MQAPVAISTAAPVRQALILAPSHPSQAETARGALAQADASQYRVLLRLLGFEVTLVAAQTRPDIDQSTRAFANSVKANGEVAVFLLGGIYPSGGSMYVLASDVPPASKPALARTEGVSVGEILRRIAERAPRVTVAFVDECGGGEIDPVCATDRAVFPDQVSGILARRVSRSGGGGPQRLMPSLRLELLPLMQQPELNFFSLYGQLSQRLSNSNLGIASSAALTSDFRFLPADFFRRLRHDCNGVDDNASEATVRAQTGIERLVAACQQGANTWTFTAYFRDKLAVAREQRDFQRAVAGCDQAAIRTYLDTYPNGRFRSAVEQQIVTCRPAPPQPPPPPPPPVYVPPTMRERAQQAVTNFYRLHSFQGSPDMLVMRSLYPAHFTKYGKTVSRSEHIDELERYFRDRNVIATTMRPDLSGLDISDCNRAERCLVRGTFDTETVRSGGQRSQTTARFTIEFDLDRNGIVLYECSERMTSRSCR